MSGVWYKGRWYESTGCLCRKCGHPVFPTDLKEGGYEYQCFHCDEDLFSFEVDEAKWGLHPVTVARPFDGVPLNGDLEYLLDENGEVIVFKTPLDAEAYLMERGVAYDDLLFYYLLVHDGVPEGEPEA